MDRIVICPLRAFSILSLILLTICVSITPFQASAQDDLNAIVVNTGPVPLVNSAEASQPENMLLAARTSVPGDGNLTTTDPDVLPVVPPGEEASIQSVIGTDTRSRITDTRTFPYSAITHITSSAGSCSGWMISANTVVTAGHCLHTANGWVTNVKVYPGRNGSFTPYGSCSARQLYTVNGWKINRSRSYDYGAIKLNCTIGNSTGFFGYRTTSRSLTGQPSYIAGYPGDKPGGTQWRGNGSVQASWTSRLYYDNDTFNGQSGSIVWNNEANCWFCAIAIHAYGIDSNTGYNGGTRITPSVYANLNAWKNAP